MARSHHRKKHKEQLRQFKHSQDMAENSGAKSKAANIIMIAGALAGFAIGYFASGGIILWMTVGLLAGAAAGYYVGKKIDEDR